MRNTFGIIRLASALAMIFVLAALLPATQLADCPFFSPDPAGAHESPCCPTPKHDQHEAPRCPLAPTLEICPFYITEAKLGITEGKVQSADAINLTQPVALLADSSESSLDRITERLPDQSSLHLKNRVFLI
ncbi:MAG: hypothetical protein ACK5AZ_00040 [Bryobacteraceae bacterium]